MLKNSFIFSFMSLLDKAVYYFLLPVYTLYLSAEDFGVIALAVLCIGIIQKISLSPAQSALIHFFYDRDCNKQELVSLLLMYLGFMTFAICFACAMTLDEIRTYIFDSKLLLSIIVVYIFHFIFESYYSFSKQLIILNQKTKMFALQELLLIVVKSVTILVGLVVFDGGLFEVALSTTLGFMTAFVVQLCYVRKYLIFTSNIRALRAPLAFGYKLIPGNFSGIFIQAGDRIAIKYFLALSELGVFAFNFAIANIVNLMVLLPLKMVVQPMILKQKNNVRLTRLKIYDYSVVVYAVALFIALCVSSIMPLLIELFSKNDELNSGIAIIPILAFAFAYKALGGLLGFGILLGKNAGIFSFQVLISGIFNVVLNIILIPHYGIVGASFSTLFTYVFLGWMKCHFSNKYFKTYFNWKIINFLTIYYCVYLFLFFHLGNSFWLSACSIVGFGVFCCLVFDNRQINIIRSIV